MYLEVRSNVLKTSTVEMDAFCTAFCEARLAVHSQVVYLRALLAAAGSSQVSADGLLCAPIRSELHLQDA